MNRQFALDECLRKTSGSHGGIQRTRCCEATAKTPSGSCRTACAGVETRGAEMHRGTLTLPLGESFRLVLDWTDELRRHRWSS